MSETPRPTRPDPMHGTSPGEPAAPDGASSDAAANPPHHSERTERTRARGDDGVMETAFGFERVGDRTEKQARVDTVFASVARRYDAMNDLMSGGLHRVWKDAMVSRLNPSPRRPSHTLDVAGGTGDIAFRIAARSGPARVTVADISPEMLEVGRARAAKRGLADRIAFEEANAEALPYPDASFDAYTIAFGIRNVPRIEVALAEAHRVLKVGGRFLCLEFSEVDLPGLDRLYDAWSFGAIPRIGRLVTGDAESYRYLVESIRRFPNAANFKAMIERAGFARATASPMTGGIVALHGGWKL